MQPLNVPWKVLRSSACVTFAPAAAEASSFVSQPHGRDIAFAEPDNKTITAIQTRCFATMLLHPLLCSNSGLAEQGFQGGKSVTSRPSNSCLCQQASFSIGSDFP